MACAPELIDQLEAKKKRGIKLDFESGQFAGLHQEAPLEVGGLANVIQAI